MTFVATMSVTAQVGVFVLVTWLMSHVNAFSGGLPLCWSKLFSASMWVHSVNATMYSALCTVVSSTFIVHVARATVRSFMNAAPHDAGELSAALALSVATSPLNATRTLPVSTDVVPPIVILIVR